MGQSQRSAKAGFPALTSIRFFAALHVLIYHSFNLTGINEDQLPNWCLAIIGTGCVSVCLFFTLSGFILAYNYCDREKGMTTSTRDFAVARFARLYPVYLFSFFLDAPRAILFLLGRTPLDAALGKIALAGAAYLTLVQSWVPEFTNTWNSPGWSLSDEVFFYALFPLIVLLAWRVRGRFVLLSLGLLWAGSLGFSLVMAQVLAPTPDLENGTVFVRYAPILHLAEFVFGVFLGRLYMLRDESAPRRLTGTVWTLVALAGAFALLLYRHKFPWPLMFHGLLLPCFGLLLYSLTARESLLARLLANPVLVFLGNASYALYLLHQPVKWYLLEAAKALGIESGWLLWGINLAAALVVSALVYHWLEEPARRWLRRRMSGPRTVPERVPAVATVEAVR